MADWLGTRSGRFFARAVTWPGFEEGADYAHMTGGEVELSAFSDVKAKGTLKFEGEPPSAYDLIRIYYGFTDALGESETVPVATMQVGAITPTVTGDSRLGHSQRGSVALEGTLAVLRDVELNAPYTVPAGALAVSVAASLVSGAGLPVSVTDESSYAMRSDYTFAAEDANLLAIVNKLLGFAGYASAWTDAMGTVMLTPYVDPTGRTPVFTFEEGQRSVMLPEVPYSNDWASTPNVARLVYSTEDEVLAASCSNVDPEHPASLVRRGGRERTVAESVSELSGDTADERLEALKAKAEAKLIDNSAEIDYVEVGCPFLPLAPNDAIEVRYASLDWRGAITNCKFDLGDDSSATVQARRFVRTALKVQTEGQVVFP